MKKILKLLIVALIVAFCSFSFIIYGIYLGRKLEPWVTQYEVHAEAIDDENVRISITNTSTAGRGAFRVENIKVFSTTENGEMVLVEMGWPHIYFLVGDTATGTYTYGKNPRGKEINVEMHYFPPSRDPTVFRPWRVIIS